jgi:hypothetical protein
VAPEEVYGEKSIRKYLRRHSKTDFTRIFLDWKVIMCTRGELLNRRRLHDPVMNGLNFPENCRASSNKGLAG